MTKRTWHSGPPPEIGWWPASLGTNPEVIRWWNGKRWSCAVRIDRSGDYAARVARIKELPNNQPRIQWTERWWL